MFPRLPVMNGLMGAAPHFPHAPIMPSGVQGLPGFRLPPPEVPAPAHGPTSQAPSGESEQDVMSTAQRGMLKWEKEETLGELATVAPVLYCNTNFPQLKEQYPGTYTHQLHTHIISLSYNILCTEYFSTSCSCKSGSHLPAAVLF